MSRVRHRRRLALAVSAVLTTAFAVTLTAGSASALAVPKAPDLGKAIEVLSPYQPQTTCDPTAKPGVVAFSQLLLTTYRDTRSDGIVRSCTSEAGTSEHKDGRAFDWAVDPGKPAQVAEAKALFAWLFATDRYGNTYAEARRLGIMYIIYDKRIWGAYAADAGWKPYACSGVTACHQDHVHFSFGWAGALRRTSYWTGSVSPVVPPPLPVVAGTKVGKGSVSPKVGSVYTPFLVKAGVPYTVTVSGTYEYGLAPTGAADAECQNWLNRSGWKSTTQWARTFGATHLDLVVEWMSTWRPRTDTGGGCNIRDHVYTMRYTPRSTAQLRLSINDNHRGDDSGALLVAVQQAASTGR